MSAPDDPVWQRNAELAGRLFELCGCPAEAASHVPAPGPTEGDWLVDADAIVTHVEVNERHGVGVLLKRVFRGRGRLIVIRSQDHYGGAQDFGELRLRIGHDKTSRPAVFRRVLQEMERHTAARILCVPYYADDVRNAIALRAIYGAKLCTWLMDDQNIYASGIPDDLMAELLRESSLRLAISPELAAAYGEKYGCRVWLMPPVVDRAHILRELRPPPEPGREKPWGVIVGNVWGRRWLEFLRATVRASGITLRWYSRDYFRFIAGDRESLARDSIWIPEGPPLGDEDLIGVLRGAPFVAVPSGTLDESDDRRFIARMSLPSRIPFILATSHTPVLVLGDRRTAAARFVLEAGVGLVCPYARGPFQAAVERIMRPEVNLAMRQKALDLAPVFSDEGAAEWIWQSLARGAPVDDRFEKLMAGMQPRSATIEERR
jgi:hypothetical protein